ncbi:serine/threonine protein kinase [Agathobacter sp.]|uniref:serine/threonine protein kinase n=1 Tax=Agathobacter sp. TaxID=2021311 RepID=UPI0025860C76|nr:serine/threonine-protein kinase [Agathobacter sp.]
MLYLSIQDICFGKGTQTKNKYKSLSGKYELLRPLGNGAGSSVYLARHLQLGAIYAIKVSPKNLAFAHELLSEGRLLQSLHHPGIPQIYDYVEDDEYTYLIEEWMDGESISEYFLHQPIISPQTFYQWSLQLCDIFCYLHEAITGFYYQDLKPEHLLLCNGQIKLIDFCVNCCNGETIISVSGNQAFSAPEVLSGGLPTEASDVYSLGCIVEFFARHVENDLPQELNPIIQTAKSAEPMLRYETVDAFRTAILQTKPNDKQISCNHIAILGSFHGCGASHIGIALTCALNRLGYPALFREEDDVTFLQTTLNNHLAFRIRDGIFYRRYFIGVPKYGPGIVIDEPTVLYQITVHTNSNSIQLTPSSRVLLIGDGSPWQIDKCIAMNETLFPYRDRVTVLCTSGNREYQHRLSKALGCPVLSFHDDSDAFCITKEKLSFFKKLLNL